MASTTVQFNSFDGLTLTLKLYAEGSDTLANAGGDACTEATNRNGTYTATVTEALAGIYDARVTDASDNTINRYKVRLADDTSTYECAEPWTQFSDVVDVAGATEDLPTATALATAQTDLDTITGSDGVTLATAQALYAPAKVADLGTVQTADHTASIAAILTDTGTTLDAAVSAIKTKTDFLPSATAGAAGGVFIAGTNAATTITTALTTTFTGNVTGSVASVTGNVDGSVASVTGAVGSVTGAVGSVTGAVGSVAGNVDGNVSGTVILADTSSDAIIADAVWNAATVTYGGVGSYGEHVETLTAGGDATEAKQDSIIAAVITNAAGVDIAADIIAVKAETAAIVADTNSLETEWADGGRLDVLLDGAASAGDPWTTAIPGAYGAGTAGNIVGNNLDAASSTLATAAALATVDTNVDAILVDTNELQGDWVDGGRLDLILDGAGGSSAQVLQNTTIATLASQTSFTLTAGSTDDNAYNGAIAILTDQSTSTQKAFVPISAYTGSTKTVTLGESPAFTIATGDTVDVVAAISDVSIWTYASRTLTQSTPTAQDVGLNGRLNLTGGYDWSIPSTLGALGTWTELWFTMKDDNDDLDSAAEISIKLSNPGDGGDGLQILNGAAGTASQGSIVVNDAVTGEVTVTVYAVATVEIDPNEGRWYKWDIKKLAGSGSAPYIGAGGVITIARGTTRAT